MCSKNWDYNANQIAAPNFNCNTMHALRRNKEELPMGVSAISKFQPQGITEPGTEHKQGHKK